MIKALCHFFLHNSSPIIGFTREVQPTNKQNHSGFALGGLFILRACDYCDDVFTRDGLADMVGHNKHAVRVGPSMLFVEACRNGCPPEDLYVVIQDAQADTVTPPKILIGCNFCKVNLMRSKINSALQAWAAAQIKRP